MVSAWSGIRPLVIETEDDKRLQKEKEEKNGVSVL